MYASRPLFHGLLFTVFCFAGCTAKKGEPADVSRVQKLWETADLVLFLDGFSGDSDPVFYVEKPFQSTHSGKGKRFTKEELNKTLPLLTIGRSLAVVKMQKASNDWTSQQLDSIEALLKENGFRKVVIYQAVNTLGADGKEILPILRE